MQISVPLSAHSSWGPSPRRGAAGPCGDSAFDVFRDHQTVSAAAAPSCVLRERAGFSRSEVGRVLLQRHSGGSGGGEAACAHTARVQTESEPDSLPVCLSKR